jgi:hypothetical protein
MHCLIVVILCTLGGLIVGAVFHSVFAAKQTASKQELTALSTRLKAAFDSDTQRAKTEVAAVIADIEKKL